MFHLSEEGVGSDCRIGASAGLTVSSSQMLKKYTHKVSTFVPDLITLQREDKCSGEPEVLLLLLPVQKYLAPCPHPQQQGKAEQSGGQLSPKVKTSKPTR